jgi:hypothetical protein
MKASVRNAEKRVNKGRVWKMLAQFDLKKFSVKKFDAILARGLSHGMGSPDGQMCIEAAICNVMGLPHGDDPGCVVASVRWFKLALNIELKSPGVALLKKRTRK